MTASCHTIPTFPLDVTSKKGDRKILTVKNGRLNSSLNNYSLEVNDRKSICLLGIREFVLYIQGMSSLRSIIPFTPA